MVMLIYNNYQTLLRCLEAAAECVAERLISAPKEGCDIPHDPSPYLQSNAVYCVGRCTPSVAWQYIINACTFNEELDHL